MCFDSNDSYFTKIDTVVPTGNGVLLMYFAFFLVISEFPCGSRAIVMIITITCRPENEK